VNTEKLKEFTLLSSQYIFASFWLLASLFYIESGANITEIRTTGYHVGATSKYLVFLTTFLLASYAGYLAVSKWHSPPVGWRIGQVRLNAKLALNLSIAGILTPLAVYLAASGIPFLSGTDRIVFWKTIALPGQQILFNQIPLVAFLAGFLLIQDTNARDRRLCILTFTSCIIFQLLHSETFTGLTVSAYMFFAPLFCSPRWRAMIAKHKKKLLIFCIASGASVLLLKFSGAYVQGIGGPYQVAMNRIFALQGQLWWGVNASSNHVDALGLAGMQALMYIMAPTDVFNTYTSAGISFAMGYPAILVLEFGSTALLVHAFFAVAFGTIIALLSRAIRSNDILLAVVVAKLYTHIYVIITSGNLHEVASLKTFLFCAAALFLLALAYGRRHAYLPKQR